MKDSDCSVGSANWKTVQEFPSFDIYLIFFLLLDFYPKPTALRVAQPGLLAWRTTGKFRCLYRMGSVVPFEVSLTQCVYLPPYCHLHSAAECNGGRWISKAKFTNRCSSRLGSPWPHQPAPSPPGKYDVCVALPPLNRTRVKNNPPQNQCLLWARLSVPVWCEVGTCAGSHTYQGLTLEKKGVKWEPQTDKYQTGACSRPVGIIPNLSHCQFQAAKRVASSHGVWLSAFLLRLSRSHSAQCRQHLQHRRLPSLRETPEPRWRDNVRTAARHPESERGEQLGLVPRGSYIYETLREQRGS